MTGSQAWAAKDSAKYLLVPDASSNKYRRGALALRTGSTAYPGAAGLGAEAAWRAGVGLVRYTPPLGDTAPQLGLPTPAAAVLAARPETMFTDGYDRLSAHCDAWLVGSGTDPAQRSFAEREALRRILTGEAPVVVDAGALGELVNRVDSDRWAPAVATPHAGEFESLWLAAGLPDSPHSDTPRERAALALAERLDATVLLKGSLTIAATPGGFCATIGPATPWLATAGTGDVLAGILGALVATHAEKIRADPELLGPLAATASHLHDCAARHAMATMVHGTTSGAAVSVPITALDVAHALPAAIAALIA